MLSLVLMLFIALCKKMGRKNGSGDNRDDWVTYLVESGLHT